MLTPHASCFTAAGRIAAIHQCGKGFKTFSNKVHNFTLRDYSTAAILPGGGGPSKFMNDSFSVMFGFSLAYI